MTRRLPYPCGVFYIPGPGPDAKVEREAVIRSLTKDELVRQLDCEGFHVSDQVPGGTVPDNSYLTAMGQSVAKVCAVRVTDVALQLLDSARTLQDTHVHRHLGFKPETRAALLDPTSQ
jgi:hypothetical protein